MLVAAENDTWHINLAELDAVMKGVNLALQWLAKRLHLCIDSLCVYHWVSNMMTGKARICIKAREMLIKQRLAALKSLVSEYNLTVIITLVMSHCNLADQLTRVLNKWYIARKMGVEAGGQICAATVSMKQAADKRQPCEEQTSNHQEDTVFRETRQPSSSQSRN